MIWNLDPCRVLANIVSPDYADLGIDSAVNRISYFPVIITNQ